MRKKEVERMLSKAVRGAYAKGYSDAGASLSRRALKGFLAQSGAPKEDIDYNNYTLRQRGRMLYMSAPVATSAVNTTRTKIVGSGLKMRCAVNYKVLGISQEAARDWQRNTEAEWRLFAEKGINCDALGLSNFYDLQQIAVKSWLMSGDVFALIKRGEPTPTNPYSLRIQLVEADRISTPSSAFSTMTDGKNPDNGNLIYDGVEIDKDGKIAAYYICNSYPNQYLAQGREWVRVEAFGENTGLPNILQVMDAERPDQYRGVTFLAPVIEPLLQLRRYTESELVAALIQSYLTAWITTQTDNTEFPFNEVGAGDIDGEPSEQPDDVSKSENEYEMGPGTINHLAPGENVILGNPNIPTAGFEAFVKAIEKMCGAGLEIPYDVLLKEFNASYSASKGSLEEAWETVKMRRTWFTGDFCQPIYEIWLSEAVATGRIKAPGFFDNPLIRDAWSSARWDGPAQTHLDPVKEAKANEILIAHGWKTNEQITREYYGGNWEENVDAVLEENKIFGKVNEGE